MSHQEKKIRRFLHHQIDIVLFDEIDSTNNEAKRRVTSPIPRPLLLCAASQSAGRGRRGHDFYSPKGTGLYLSVVLPAVGIEVQPVTCAAAVAAATAIEELCEHTVGIKWVNDLYVDGRKVCGILTELLCDSDNRPIAVCVGIGVNLTTASFSGDYPAGSIGNVDRDRLCAMIADRLIDCCRDGGYMDSYRARSIVIGRTVTFTDSDGSHTATAVGISDSGELIVHEKGIKRVLSSGEISVTLY